MILEEIEIDKLKPMEKNPRKITKKEIEDLRKSINEFGNVQTLVVNKDNTIIGGHQRLDILKEFNYKKVNIVRVDLDEDRAKILNIALNKTGGDFDVDLLPNFLDGIDTDRLIGFTENDLKEIKLDMNFDDLSEQYKKLEKEKNKEITWKATFDEKEFDKIKKIIQKLKTNNKFGNFKSDYCNGLVLKKLCENYEKNIK